MSTKTEKAKATQLQDKCQTVLNTLLRDEDNKYCVDCDSKGPRWASWNIGVFLCIRCAGIHRNLGVHISKVKSVNLDAWTPEQVVSLQQMGNSRARAVYEANLPDNFRRPQSDSSLESFIRAKYEHKKYIAREWVPPPLPKVNWEKEIDEEIERQKRKKKTIVEKKPLAAVEVPQLPKPTNPSPKPSRPQINTQEVKDKKGSDLLGLQNGESDNSFGSFFSAPVQETVKEEKVDIKETVKSEEESFFNQSLPTEKEKVKLDKDSILALYGNTPSVPSNNFNPYPNAASQVPYQQGNFPVQQSNFQAFGGYQQQQQQAFPVQNGVQQITGQWPGQAQWGKQPGAQVGQFPAQNQVQYIPNHYGQFQNGQSSQFTNQQVNIQVPATNQFGPQFQQPNTSATFSQMPNPFFANQTNIQQQFGNLSLSSAPTNGTTPLATNTWQ